MKNHLDTLYAIKETPENSFSMKSRLSHRNSKLVRYHDRGAVANPEGINHTIMEALHDHYGSVIQRGKLGCTSLTLHGFLCSFFLLISARFFDCKIFSIGFFQHVFKNFLRPFLLLFVLSLAFACSDATTAERGTGSDGESFIYGMTVDSLANETLFASEIILARVEWVDSEYQETALDTVYSDIDGNFSLFPADTGEYMLRLNWNDSLYAQVRSLSFDGDTLALGKVGLYRPIEVSGVLPVPECANAEIQTVGFPETVSADSTGSFVLKTVHAGRGELVAYCDGTTYSWVLVLSGACREASLGTLEITGSNSKQSAASGAAGGSQNLQKQSQPIVVDAHCNVK